MFVNIIACLGSLLSVDSGDIKSINKAADAASELEELLGKTQKAYHAGLLMNAQAFDWMQEAMHQIRLELSGKDEYSGEWHGKQLFVPASLMIDMTMLIINETQIYRTVTHEEEFRMYAESLRYRISKLNAAWQDEQMAKAGFQ